MATVLLTMSDWPDRKATNGGVPRGRGAGEADAETAVAPTEPTFPTERIASSDPTAPASVGAQAWSQEDDAVDDPVPYSGVNPYGSDAGAMGWNGAAGGLDRGVTARWWQRVPLLAFAIAAAAALVALGSAAVVMRNASHTGSSTPSSHVPASTPARESPQVPASSAASPPRVPAEVPSPPMSQPPLTVTRTRTRPPSPTTQPPASAVPPITPPATTEPPPPITPPPTETTPAAPPMTTAYLRVPFVPVPIPIQVPSNPNQPPQYQQPQYPYGQGPPY
jgi:hypothetical protein